MTKPVFVALDLADSKQLNDILEHLGDPHEVYLKIGMELFYNAGHQTVQELAQKGYHIFLDLKLMDIPNTVYNGMKQLAKLGIAYVTVHALGGSQMIAAAKAGLTAGTPGTANVPQLLAVTELTSISDAALANEQNCKLTMQEQVLSLAQLAAAAGADGVVCSPLEVPTLKQKLGADFLYVTPGIRPTHTTSDDQVRTATPKEASQLGASALVVGRPITLATDPAAAYQAIKEDFNA